MDANFKFKKLKLQRTYEIFSLFIFVKAAPAANGSSQARCQIEAAAVSLRHNHGNARSKTHLQPTPQLAVMPGPLTH